MKRQAGHAGMPPVVNLHLISWLSRRTSGELLSSAPSRWSLRSSNFKNAGAGMEHLDEPKTVAELLGHWALARTQKDYLGSAISGIESVYWRTVGEQWPDNTAEQASLHALRDRHCTEGREGRHSRG